jgi:hypothetical protein
MRTAVAAIAVAFCIVCFGVRPVSALGAPPVSPAAGAVPDGLGVNIHFADPRPGEMEMLVGAGFTWIRMDFGWEATEHTPGQYDFSQYDRLLATLDRHHLRAVLILDYSNHLYDDGLSPHTDEGRAAFARWAAAAAVHFKGRGVLWETWNEPNIGQFWKPKPSADDYAKLALATAKAIHEAVPDESVAGPATSRVDLPFLETCFAAGLLEHWSAVTVHPYRQEDPDTAAGDYRKLRELMAKCAPKGKPLPPIVSGEWGYSSGWKKFDEAKQGKMLPREWMTNLSEGIPLSIWYDWHDDGPDPKEPEHHFGTVRYEYHEGKDLVYAPKPAYLAARTLTTALEGFHFVRRVDVGAPDDYVLRFENGDKVRLVAWTRASEQRPVTVPAADAPAGHYAVTGHTGEKLQGIDATAAGLKMTLTDAPQYLARE